MGNKTKAELLKQAQGKLKRLSKAELLYFIENVNCCPHPSTHQCGMDVVCNACGEYV